MADLINFKSSMDAFQVGRRANMEEWNTVTGNNPNAAVIPFGAPVMASGTYNGCREIDATTGRNVMGITEASLMLPHPGDGYRQYDNVAVCEVGVIGVKIGASAVTRGALARWDTVNKVWTAAAQSATVVTIPGAQFAEDFAANSVGTVRYRRPVPSLSVSGA